MEEKYHVVVTLGYFVVVANHPFGFEDADVGTVGPLGRRRNIFRERAAADPKRHRSSQALRLRDRPRAQALPGNRLRDRTTTKRRGPWAPMTRIFSMSAVRLEPVIRHSMEFFLSAPRSRSRANAASRSGTNCSTLATTMCTGATTEAPRPPQAAETKTEPVCATSASASVIVAWEASAGPPSLDHRKLRSLLPERQPCGASSGASCTKISPAGSEARICRDGRRAGAGVGHDDALGVVLRAFLLKAVERIGDCRENRSGCSLARVLRRGSRSASADPRENALAARIFSLLHDVLSKGRGTIWRECAVAA